jgi:hypothetical protein
MHPSFSVIYEINLNTIGNPLNNNYEVNYKITNTNYILQFYFLGLVS